MKNYVRVLALYNEEGDIRPVKMEWEERWLDVDRVPGYSPGGVSAFRGRRTALHLQHCRRAHLFVFRGDKMVF